MFVLRRIYNLIHNLNPKHYSKQFKCIFPFFPFFLGGALQGQGSKWIKPAPQRASENSSNMPDLKPSGTKRTLKGILPFDVHVSPMR